MASPTNPQTSQHITISERFDPPSIQSDISGLRQIICSAMPAKTEIVHQQEWSYIHDQYAFAAFLINREIVLYWVKGNVKKRDCDSVERIMRAVITYADKQQLYQILDLSNIRSFSLAARKSYEKINDQLSPFWQKSYYIFSGLGNTIFKIYAAINPAIRQSVILAESLSLALKLCRENVTQAHQTDHQRFDPQQASQTELLQEYLQLETKYRKLQSDQKKKADALLENIARISWDENFEVSEPPIPQDDPFYNVFGALSLLKQDLGEIYDRQRQTNRTLEAKVAQRTWQLSSVIENTSDMIMSVDREWQIQVVNTAFQQHFREFQQSDVRVGDKLLPLYADEANLRYWTKRFERAFAGERFQEQVSIKVEEQNIYYELTYNPIRKAGQQDVTEVSVFGRNITALRRAEEVALENEKNLIRALKIARAGSWELNLESGEIVIGREGLEVIGYPDQQELKLSIDDFVRKMLHPEDVPLVQERIAYAATQIDNPDFQDQFQYRLFHRNGQVLHLMLYSRFKSDERGVIYGITQDISRQKESEEQLLQQNTALRKLNSELDHFVYSVSHDLRAPLASVLGLINIARQEKDIGTLMHYLDLKEKSIHKLDVYIREIIDLSKNARLTITKEEIDFQKLIEDVYEGQHYDESTQGVVKLKEVKQSRKFFSDYKRLRVILQNLVSNALRYADLRQPQPFVKVRVIVESDAAVMVVEDNGLGIRDTYLPHIFKMFYRANDIKTGSGLGLYIVKETLEKLEGNISVQSDLGKGTKFTLNLPSLHP